MRCKLTMATAVSQKKSPLATGFFRYWAVTSYSLLLRLSTFNRAGDPGRRYPEKRMTNDQVIPAPVPRSSSS